MSPRRVPGVLAVDNDPSSLRTIAASLGRYGYRVSAADSIDEALRCLERSTFDCVLVDQELELASEGRLLAQLSRYPAQTVSLIVLTRPRVSSAVDALRRGAYDYLSKPVDPDLLRVTIARAIERATLARTTRELLEEVEAANAELRAAGQQLQRRVEEATRDLRAKVEELDRARDELETARRQRDEFIRVIAHELGGPLTAVEGYATMLCEDDLPEELRRRAAAVIRSETRRMARLVDDLASPAHSPDELDLKLTWCDLVEVVLEQVELARALSPDHPILVDMPSGGILARCDRDRVGQVVFNLLSNALKYSRSGDIRVRVRVKRRNAQVSVIDSGPGIPPDRLEAIFEPHVRLVQPGEGQPRGSGLGLYVAREIAEAHGGDLRAESNGSGASFTLSLPLVA
jgi:signal transduction histidine kinase